MLREFSIPLVLAALCVVLVSGVYYAGYSRAGAKYQLELAEREAEIAMDRTARETLYRQRERALFDAITAAEAAAQKEISDVRKDRDRVAADLANHRLHYTIPITERCPVPTAGVDTASAPAETRAELSVGAAQFLDGLAARADEVTIERNECVDILRKERVLQ